MSETREVLPESLVDYPDEEIVQALVDAPAGTNLAESGLGRRIIHEDNDPNRWAELCLEARNLIGADERRERYAALCIEQVNGLRRALPPTVDTSQLDELLRLAEGEIIALHDNNPQRAFLQEQRFYQGSQVAMMTGEFDRAAGYYEQAAGIATIAFSLRLNQYMAAYCRLAEALTGGDEDVIRTRYYAFYADSERLVAVLDRSAETDNRWYGNVLCHRRMFDWLCGKEDRVANILSLTEIGELEPRAAFKDALALLGAVYLSRQGSRSLFTVAYEGTRRFVDDPASSGEWRVLALLFLAEMDESNAGYDRARSTLNTLINLEGHGGYVARAIARRRLENLSE